MGRKKDLPKDQLPTKKAKAAPAAPAGGSDNECTFVDRIKNIGKNNFRGLIGVIVPLIVTIVVWDAKDKQSNTKLIWFCMFWFFLFHPMNIPCVSMLTVFAFTVFAIVTTEDVCKCFFNSGIALFILAGWVSMGMICSNFHIRCISKLMSQKALSKNEMIVRTSLTTYIMSMFTNRLLICEHMMKIVVNAMDADPAADEGMKLILANVVTASATFGGLGFVHGTPCVVGLLAIVKGTIDSKKQLPDFMNYFEYSLRAIPLGMIMLLLNIFYSILKTKNAAFNPVSASSVQQQLAAAKDELPPKATFHEYGTVFFTAVMLISLFFRWSQAILGLSGWSPRDEKKLKDNNLLYPQISDPTPLAVIVILMHMLPSTMGWTRYFRSMTQSSVPILKPENGMLFFKFIDKRTHYGYLLLMGAGGALCKAVMFSAAPATFNDKLMEFIIGDNCNWAFVLFTTIASCFMSSIAVVVLLSPLCYLADGIVFYVALSAAFGLTSPFYYTPAYYFHSIAGFPLLKQIKTAVPTVIIAALVLLAFSFVGSYICWEICWAEASKNLTNAITTTTAAPAAY